jgi:hypothetical protein
MPARAPELNQPEPQLPGDVLRLAVLGDFAEPDLTQGQAYATSRIVDSS